MAVWSSCLWPVAVRGEELAVALSTTPDSTSSNAWPARPRRARPLHSLRLTLLRALHCTPSGVRVCACLRPANLPLGAGSVYVIEIGSNPEIGSIERHATGSTVNAPCWTSKAVRDPSAADRENRLPVLSPRSVSEISPSVGMQPPRRFPCSKLGPTRIGFPRLAARVGPSHLDDGRWFRFPSSLTVVVVRATRCG